MNTSENDRTNLIQRLTGAAFGASPEGLQAAIAAIEKKQVTRKLITARTAADIIPCHKETVLRYGRHGILTPFKIGPRKLRFDRAEVEALANGEKIGGAV